MVYFTSEGLNKMFQEVTDDGHAEGTVRGGG